MMAGDTCSCRDCGLYAIAAGPDDGGRHDPGMIPMVLVSVREVSRMHRWQGCHRRFAFCNFATLILGPTVYRLPNSVRINLFEVSKPIHS